MNHPPFDLSNQKSWVFLSHGQEDTEKYAARLAKTLSPPYVLFLKGDLGAGKTTFTRGFVAGLTKSADQKVHVKSPTYALAHSYATEPIVHHMDLYRLSSSTEAYELGLTEQINDENTLCIIEWPKDIMDEVSKHIPVLEIIFEDIDQNTRNLSFKKLQ